VASDETELGSADPRLQPKARSETGARRGAGCALDALQREILSGRGHVKPAESASTRVEVRVLDGQVPVRIEDFEASLLFLLVTFLVGKELLD
jgi:hypothetical protein